MGIINTTTILYFDFCGF